MTDSQWRRPLLRTPGIARNILIVLEKSVNNINNYLFMHTEGRVAIMGQKGTEGLSLFI